LTASSTILDGEDATRRRIDIARQFIPSFGVATECGIARARKPDVVERTLALYAAVTQTRS